MPVDRCVCFDITFAELRDAAQRDSLDFEQLRQRFGCGRGCSLCVPYVKLMLETGRTSFQVDEAPRPPGNL